MSHAPTAPLDAIFAALADPTRRAILTMLLEDDMAVTDRGRAPSRCRWPRFPSI